jgi:glycosyltransferase involved in cell wall biosynthesis
MSCLFVNHTNDFFGAERVLLKVMQASALSASDVQVIEPSYRDRQDAFRSAVQKAGYPVLRLAYKNLGGSLTRSVLALLYNIPAVIRLCRLIKRENITCIWSNTSLCCLGIVAAKLTGVKHVWHIHEPAEKEHDYVPNLKIVYRSLFRYPRNTFVFVTREQQTKWQSLYPSISGRSRLIYTPADPYQRTRIKDSVCRFGYLGSWSKRKNIPMLIEAFEQLHAQYPDTQLLIARNIGEDADRIYRMISRLPDPSSVCVEAFEQAQAFYDRIDVLVLPSFSETWGLVAVEAMQQGIATVLTQQTALKEIAEDGVHTRYINPYDRHSLVEAMQQMCDATYRNRIAQKGMEQVKKMDFDGQFVRQIQELI